MPFTLSNCRRGLKTSSMSLLMCLTKIRIFSLSGLRTISLQCDIPYLRINLARDCLVTVAVKYEAPIGTKANKSRGRIYKTNGRIYKTNGRIYKTNERIYKTNGRIYKTNERIYIYKTNRKIYMTNGMIYMTNGRIYKTNQGDI